MFMIYADFESILVGEDNGKQNPGKMLLAVVVINWCLLRINLFILK